MYKKFLNHYNELLFDFILTKIHKSTFFSLSDIKTRLQIFCKYLANHDSQLSWISYLVCELVVQIFDLNVRLGQVLNCIFDKFLFFLFTFDSILRQLKKINCVKL